VDIFLIAVFMLALILLRQAELQVLVKLGVYKNVENLTDKEMFSEYDKLKKQSLKLQKRLRKQNRNRERQARQDTQEDFESDIISDADDFDSRLGGKEPSKVMKKATRDSLASQ